MTSGTTTTTSTEVGAPISMEIMLIAGGAVVIIIVGIFFVKRKA